MYMLPTVYCLHELEVSSALAARYKEVQIHAARSKYSSSAIVAMSYALTTPTAA